MAGLTKRLIDATKIDPERDFRLWDDDPRGFGVRFKPSGAKSFFVQYRSPENFKKRRFTIGAYGVFTLDQARTEARRLLAMVAKGEDPAAAKKRAKALAAATAVTVADLCDDYMRDARKGLVMYRGRPKKASTLAIDDGRIRRHVKPLLGDKLTREVTQDDIEAFMHDVRLGKTAVTEKTGFRGVARVTGGDTAAVRAVGLLGSIFSYAVKRKIRPDNPVHGLEKPKGRQRDRTLGVDEYRRLGEALADLENSGANPVAIRAYRVLALTGCRRAEIFGLERSRVDAQHRCLRFGDTKSGQQVRPIGAAALALISAAPAKDDNAYVFPAAWESGHLTDAKVFDRACKIAGLADVSLHTLRHGFATVAHELEYSELTIAGLLGHRRHSVTARYAHHVDRALIAAADRVSALIAARMEGREAEGAEVVHLQHKKG